MNEGRADFFGQVTKVGDQVAFMLNAGGRRVRRELTQGLVVRMVPSGIVVRHVAHWDRTAHNKLVETLCKLEFVRVPDGFRNIRLDAGEDVSKSSQVNHHKLVAVCLALYMTGRWSAPGVDDAEAARLWETLRDILGLTPGTATSLGMGASNG